MTIESVPMRCTCGGEIGPDITDRPMCYQCGPRSMLPEAKRHAWLLAGIAEAVEKSAADSRLTLLTSAERLKWWPAP